jgi:hypothetical protein
MSTLSARLPVFVSNEEKILDRPRVPLKQRRFAVARRLYKNELPEAALIAHAQYVHSVA